MSTSIYTSGDVVNTNDSFGVWEKYLDVYGLRLFAHGSLSGLPAVDDEFIKKTAETVKLMFNPNGEFIDQEAQEKALKYMKSKSTIQRIGINTHSAYQNPSLNDGPKGYDEINDLYNSNDYTWKLNHTPIQRYQITQQLEHLLHTFTDFALPGAFPEQFNIIQGKGLLWDAASEAINNGVYDDKDYKTFIGKDHPQYNNLYKSVVMREYLYCLTYAMWGYTTKYTEDYSLAPEWSDQYLTEESIKQNNPLGHQLYTDYIKKVISKPDSIRLEEIYKDDDAGISNYVVDTITPLTDETKIINKDTGAFFKGESINYDFINKGNNTYQIKAKDSFDEITGQKVLREYFPSNYTFNATDVSSLSIQFVDKTLDFNDDVKGVFDQVTGLNTDSGKMFRLYNAALNRFPDVDGLKYWIDKYSSGENDDRAVASSFLISSEFKERYGVNTSNSRYVEVLYQNVLGRDYDQSGYDYWLGNLNNGIETRHELLLGFSESAENKWIFSDMTGFW
mgnify:CR=1 FL=1